MIKDLRERTQAGMSDCKKALQECGGDMEKAVEYLRKKGVAQAAKKATRIAAEGVVAGYTHGSRIGVLVEVNCETDFVSRNADFQAFAREVAMQVAAMSPQYVSQDEIPAAVIEQERSIRLELARQQNKPEPVLQKIVEGQMGKWFKEVCLLDQIWMREDRREHQDPALHALRGRRGSGQAHRRFRRRGEAPGRPGLAEQGGRGLRKGKTQGWGQAS
jgi:elongation factor Ts